MRTNCLSNLFSGTFLTALVALSACSGTEESFSTLEEQARLSAVIEGPVPVPLLPSVASELGVGQILCDSYQLRAGDDDDDEADEEDEVYAAGDRGALSGMSQCIRTAKRMYREMQVQLVLLKHPSTVDRGLQMVSAKTTVLFPDGSYTQGSQGASGFAASYSKLFDSQQVVAIPMYGINHSYPIAVSAGIAMAEWARRRYQQGRLVTPRQAPARNDADPSG